MHELALCQAIVDTVGEHTGGRPVRRVTLRIGYLRQVVPDSLHFSWELLVAGTGLEGSVLDIEHVPAVVACTACEARTTLDWPVLACQACGAPDVELLSGDDFAIQSIDVSTEAC